MSLLDGTVPWPAEDASRYRRLRLWQGVSLGEVLRERAGRWPERCAVVDGDRQWSYRELDQRVDRMAAGLVRRGILPTQRVLVQLPNIAEFLVLCFALFRIGAVPVLALPAHRRSEIVHLLRLSEAVAYVTADTHLGFDFRSLARQARLEVETLRHVFVVGEAQEFVPLQDVDAPPCAFDPPDAGDVAVLLLSGGTTGLPKLIPRTHEDYFYNASASAELMQLGDETRYLLALPASHNFPLACPGLLGVLHAGGTVVCCADPSPDVAFALIEKERITVTALIPPLVMLWLEFAEWAEADLSSLRWLQVGGARLKPEIVARVRGQLGCGLQQVYGMAEGLICCTRFDDADDIVQHTQGRPLSSEDDVRVVDEHDQPVEDGVVGELQVRGPYTIRGYYRASDHNRTAFTADGFYRSGDSVRRLPSGHIVVEGRNKDVINRGGEKVPVEAVENLLLRHPSVQDVAIVGVPDDILGECSCACVVARGEAPTLGGLNAHLSQLGLAAFKLPDRLVVMSHFPLTRLGKVDRRALGTQVK